MFDIENTSLKFLSNKRLNRNEGKRLAERRLQRILSHLNSSVHVFPRSSSNCHLSPLSTTSNAHSDTSLPTTFQNISSPLSSNFTSNNNHHSSSSSSSSSNKFGNNDKIERDEQNVGSYDDDDDDGENKDLNNSTKKGDHGLISPFDSSSVTSDTWFNVIGLLVLSQLTSVTKIQSILRNHIILPSNNDPKMKQTYLSSLFTMSEWGHALGFFVGGEVCKNIGVKNSTLLSSIIITLGSASLTAMGGSMTDDGNRASIMSTFLSYGTMSIGSGIMDRTAFINMVQNLFSDQERVMIAIYLALSSLAPVWQSPLITFLIQKCGFRVTCLIFALVTLLSLPILSLMTVNRDLPTTIPPSAKTKTSTTSNIESLSSSSESSESTTNHENGKNAISLAGIPRTMRSHLKVASYIFSLLTLFSGKSILQSQGASMLETCVNMSPMKSSLISGLGSASTLASRVGFFDYLMNNQTKQTARSQELRTDYLLSSIMVVLAVVPAVAVLSLRYNNNNNNNNNSGSKIAANMFGEQTLFSVCMLIIYNATAMILPLMRQINQSSEVNFENVQALLPLIASTFPTILSYVKEKWFSQIRKLPSRLRNRMADADFYKSNLLMLSVFATTSLLVNRLQK